MKTLLLTFAVLSLSSIKCQDTLITQTNEIYQVLILSETHDQIEFYLIDDPEKEIKTLPKKYFKEIRYNEVPSGSNLIVVESDSLSDFEYFRSWVMFLKEKGYMLKNIDKDFLMLSTTFMDSEKRILSQISLSVSGSKAYLRSYVKSTVKMGMSAYGVSARQSDDNIKRSCKGNKAWNDYTRGFDEIERISKMFVCLNNGNIYIQIEE